MGRVAVTAIGALLASLGFSAAAGIFVDERFAPSIFAVYEDNRREGVPNYVTEDLLLVSYGLIRVSVGKSLERGRYLGQLEHLASGLHEAVAKEGAGNAASRANRDYVAVLAALAAGRNEATGSADRKRAQAELDLVLAANEVAASPLWGYRMDYGQFLPRGHYDGDEALTRYFRAVRYAGAALFAVKPSRATGVSRSLANRMAQQAAQLARLIDADAELSNARRELLANLAWRFGPAEDLSLGAVLAVPAKPGRTYAERLFAHAQAEGMQPRIVGGIVDVGRLEKAATPLDVLTGWRLLPQRRTADYAAFQRLVFDGTGPFEGDAEAGNAPFGLAMIDGQAAKAFPLLAELMHIWGSGRSTHALEDGQEHAFAGYGEALELASQELAAAQGLAGLHRQLLQTGLTDDSGERLTAMRAFWTWQRYAALLYAKQSYTPAGKGLPMAQPARIGATVEPSLALYQSLALVVEGHRRFTPHASWDEFAEVLAQVMGVASRQLLLGAPTSAEDERFLNALDVSLKRIAGGGDQPIVVDAHVSPAHGLALQEATGWASEVWTSYPSGARGARFTQCEFKHPLDDRLTDAKWRDLLATGQRPGTAAACAAAQVPKAARVGTAASDSGEEGPILRATPAPPDPADGT